MFTSSCVSKEKMQLDMGIQNLHFALSSLKRVLSTSHAGFDSQDQDDAFKVGSSSFHTCL